MKWKCHGVTVQGFDFFLIVVIVNYEEILFFVKYKYYGYNK